MNAKPLIYLVCGVPGSGKTYVCQKLNHKFTYVANDDHFDGYLEAILKAASLNPVHPLLIEAPFSVSSIKDPLESKGFTIIPVFIIEKPEIVSERYKKREGKEISKGNLTRLETFKKRAIEWKCFSGTSDEVLVYLSGL